MKNPLPYLLAVLGLLLLAQNATYGQTGSTGCVRAGFGVDAGLYTGQIEYGTGSPALNSADWYPGVQPGRWVIDTNGTSSIRAQLQTAGFNGTYEQRMNSGIRSATDISGTRSKRLIDAVFARDPFGGTGFIDPTSYPIASKNGEDPATWSTGPANVLGKNDLIDVAGHMFRDIDTDPANPRNELWFVGFINRAEPGGDAYLDFEFFIEEVTYTAGAGMSSGGPDLGHTAFTFDNAGNITRIGDIIFNLSLTGGGETPNVESRIWVSRADYDNLTPVSFNWGPSFDGPYQGSPYGYAIILPRASSDICGYVNKDGEAPTAPPWGTKGTKAHVWGTSYIAFSAAEVAINMTSLGLDHESLFGYDGCFYPIHTFMVKSRASNAFTAQLKDFTGPYKWGQINLEGEALSTAPISCLNPTVNLIANPNRTDATYQWTTTNGNIITPANQRQITVDQPGDYTVKITLSSDGCDVEASPVTVTSDATKPFFGTPQTATTISCTGNSGTVDLTVTGGTAPYSYTWSKDGDASFTATTQDLTGLAPGTYEVLITDVWGCQIIGSNAVVSAKNEPVISPTLDNPDCFGNRDGNITLGVSGGTPQLTYRWSNGQTVQSLSNVGAGSYTVTITDGDMCTTTRSYTLSQPGALTISPAKTDDTDASLSVANGTISLSVTGGTAATGYTYSWSNGATTQDLTGLARGVYTVTVTDDNGCTAVATIPVFEPELCNDDIDNDGDGLTDCLDEDCQPAPPTNLTLADTSPCSETNVLCSVTTVTSYSYIWSFPPNVTIVEGVDANGVGESSVTVRWTSTVPGQVCVRTRLLDCLSAPVCITTTPIDVPFAPATIEKN
jgi:hypothetical protein